MTVAEQVHELQVDQLAWVFLLVHKGADSLFVRLRKAIVGVVVIVLHYECIDATLARVLLRVDLVLTLHNFVADALEAVLEKVANLVE